MANSTSPLYPNISDQMTRQILEDILTTQSSSSTLWVSGGGGGAGHKLPINSGIQYASNGGNYSTGAAIANATIGVSKGMQLPADGDVKFGDVSLKDFMETVSRRLAMLTPNPKLEAEWDELRTLGEAYRALEKDLTEKSQTWDILKRT